jgi:hypothetical protein
MRIRTVKLLLLATVSAISYHLAYFSFLHEVFEYADFRYESMSLEYICWTYFAAVFPIVAARKSNSPSAVGGMLIYVLSYVPIQMTLTFISIEKTYSLFGVQLAMIFSMLFLFRSSIAGKDVRENIFINSDFSLKSKRVVVPMGLMAAIGVLLILFEYRSVIRFASFEDVYDLRGDANRVQTLTVTNYLVMWITFFIGPFYLARAIFCKNIIDWCIGVFLLFVVYISLGAKIAILTPFIMYGMKYIENGGDDFSSRLLLAVSIFVLFVTFGLPDDGLLLWIKSITLLRMFGSDGWTGAVYFEFFQKNPYTYYTHIGPINTLVGGYPYGEDSLGQVIAKSYFSNDANFNAGFWASDGFAAMGIAGVIIITVFLGAFMRMLDIISIKYPARFLNLWLIGMWMGLMNAPFTTVLISGGGLMVVVILLMGRSARV